MSRQLLAVDGSNLFMRAFHGARLWDPKNRYRPDNQTPRWPDELPRIVKAMLRGAVRRSCATDLIVALDHPSPCWRYAVLPSYKGNRHYNGPSATDLAYVLRPHLAAWGVATVEAAEYEADDVLATLATRCVEAGTPIDILSRDEDLLQLVGPYVGVLWPEPGGDDVPQRDDEVLDRTGVMPRQIPDLKALAGCPADNLPKVGEDRECKDGKMRVYGFTRRRAAEALVQYDSLEEIYQGLLAPDNPFSERERGWLQACKKQAFEVRSLATLVRAVPLRIEPAQSNVRGINWEAEP